MTRPVIYVLTGVNGAGKSSVGGQILADRGYPWFNPDGFAREYRDIAGCDQTEANAHAWHEGMRRLRRAINQRANFAFETTLGGDSVTAALMEACHTHDVYVWYCGLASTKLHLQRVQARVAAGGHDIPDARIRERYVKSPLNLIRLMPFLAELRVYDNSIPAASDGTVPDPVLVLSMSGGEIKHPRADDAVSLKATPDWAKPLLAAAL